MCSPTLASLFSTLDLLRWLTVVLSFSSLHFLCIFFLNFRISISFQLFCLLEQRKKKKQIYENANDRIEAHVRGFMCEWDIYSYVNIIPFLLLLLLCSFVCNRLLMDFDRSLVFQRCHSMCAMQWSANERNTDWWTRHSVTTTTKNIKWINIHAKSAKDLQDFICGLFGFGFYFFICLCLFGTYACARQQSTNVTYAMRLMHKPQIVYEFSAKDFQ